MWDEALARFERTHPGVHVRREIGPHSSSGFHDLVSQRLKNGDERVDVFFMDVVWLAEFSAAGWAAPLDDRLDAAERARFLDGAMQAATWRSRLYGVPAFVDVGLLYYRKDLLSKYHARVPQTWPELASTARTVVEGEHRATLAGYSAQLMQYEGLVCNLLELAAGNGAVLVDEGAGKSRLGDPRVLEAVAWMRDEMLGTLAPRSLLTYQEPESLALFLQGDAVFLRDWPYAWKAANDASQSHVAGRVGVAPLPRFPAGPSSGALGGWYYGVSRFSRHPDDAWELVRFLSSAETQKQLAIGSSLAPSRTELYDDRDILAHSPELAEQADAFRHAVPRPVTPMYPAVSSALQRFASRALANPESDLVAEAAATSREIDRLLAMAR